MRRTVKLTRSTTLIWNYEPWRNSDWINFC